MPNEVGCTITVSGSTLEMREFLAEEIGKKYAMQSIGISNETKTDNSTRFSMVTAWTFPKFKDIETTCPDIPLADKVVIRCAWSEPAMLGYGYWQYSDNHLIKERWFEPDQDEVEGELVPVGHYASFLKQESIPF